MKLSSAQLNLPFKPRTWTLSESRPTTFWRVNKQQPTTDMHLTNYWLKNKSVFSLDSSQSAVYGTKSRCHRVFLQGSIIKLKSVSVMDRRGEELGAPTQKDWKLKMSHSALCLCSYSQDILDRDGFIFLFPWCKILTKTFFFFCSYFFYVVGFKHVIM